MSSATDIVPESTGTAGAGTRIKINGVSKRYTGATALDSIDLTVEPGEFLTLLGPSGSGKTTLLNLIAGFTDLSEGTIEIDGEEVNNIPSHRRGLGVVFQQYALFPHMSVADNVGFPLKQRKVAKAERMDRVAEALRTVGLGGYESRFPSELSGGQQQRVAFARAMVFNPRALLMDEPLGALDKNLREKLQLEIKRIHQEVGRTFVFVTHDQEEALVLSDRIAIFNNGHIEQVGTSQELYERPATLFVATFMGESTVFRGAPAWQGDNWSLDFHGAQLTGRRAPFSGPAALVLRPESIKLAHDPAAVPDAHLRCPVTVTQSIYLGSGKKYELGLPDGSTGIARGGIVDGAGIQAGDRVLAHWDPERGALLPDTGEESIT
ncbi:MAG: ABC transporter ATP-binding protein [Arthrobacter sp.]|uniref:ABC transporter ATP-binding protein n=1 Tax=Arthrobacter sp. TaxID=1667 RepID=UPI00348798F2